MDAASRRRAIAEALAGANAPVAAGALGERFGVSRQIVVGDIALLRAQGLDIVATPRGYVLGSGQESGLRRTVACVHDFEGMERELNIMVDNGCTVLDVVIEHAVYGQLTGSLQLSSRYDVQQFLDRCARSDARPLSELTEGIHLHTLSCPDEAAYARIQTALRHLGVLVEN